MSRRTESSCRLVQVKCNLDSTSPSPCQRKNRNVAVPETVVFSTSIKNYAAYFLTNALLRVKLPTQRIRNRIKQSRPCVAGCIVLNFDDYSSRLRRAIGFGNCCNGKCNYTTCLVNRFNIYNKWRSRRSTIAIRCVFSRRWIYFNGWSS